MVADVVVFALGALVVLLTLLGVYGGSMDTKMYIFTPIITVASGVFLTAVYRNVIRKLQVIWQDWHGLWSRFDLDIGAMARSFFIEVLLQRQLYRDNRLRWVRHIFIYWGFVGLWLFDLIFFFSVKILLLPPSNAFRLFLDFGLDLYGSILLLGLTVALTRAYLVRGTRSSIYNDTPAVILFFIVTATGFLLEALRLASEPYEPHMAWSFLGLALATPLRGLDWPWSRLYEGLWLFHAAVASISIAYIPLSRMVHVVALPVGRLLESQQEMLDAKIRSVGRGLLGRG